MIFQLKGSNFSNPGPCSCKKFQLIQTPFFLLLLVASICHSPQLVITLHVLLELEKSDCAALRNNPMADFCFRYTALVDWYGL
jgi:hypothetical protein